jgi:mannose-6-phosphate isomerase-like protein (cupin superfamily)
MEISRRDACLLVPALLAATGHAAGDPNLASKAYRFEELPVRTSGGNTFRAVLDGMTHAGCHIELHETSLAPGAMPHPPHQHVHEEMFFVREGALEVTIAGRSAHLGPGSVAFVASNDEHGVRNPDTTSAQYFVLAIGHD